MAISDKLQELIDIKQDIKEAIENKGVDMTDVEFRGYAEKIDEIETGGGTQLYKHSLSGITINGKDGIEIISTTATPYSFLHELVGDIRNIISCTMKNDSDGISQFMFYHDLDSLSNSKVMYLQYGTGQPTVASFSGYNITDVVTPL